MDAVCRYAKVCKLSSEASFQLLRSLAVFLQSYPIDTADDRLHRLKHMVRFPNIGV